MRFFGSLFFYFTLVILCSLTVFGQEAVQYEDEYDQDQSRLDNYYVETDERYFNYNNLDQNNAFLNHEEPFPGKPKDQWEASIKVGGLGFEARTPREQKGFMGFMAGAAIRKSLGYVVSLRGEYQFKSSNAPELAFTQHGIFADGVFSLTNVNFHRAEPEHNIYLFGGFGVGFNNKKSNEQINGATVNYEEDNTDYMLSGGIGFSQQISQFSVGADLRYALPVNIMNTDKAITSNYVTLSVHFNIPIPSDDRVESLWWKNPLVYAYSELNIPKHQKTFKVKFADEDEDGVADDFDQEPNTRRGCPVNPLGITLDTDKDGVPDCDDLEPITPTRCQPVNDDGIGKCPEPRFNKMDIAPNFAFDTNMPALPQSLQDEDQDGVPDIYDRSPNTPAGCPVDARGDLLDTDKDGVPDCYDAEIITPSYCQPVDSRGVGNCLPSNCCDGLKFKDPAQYDDYKDKLKEQQKAIDSLNDLLNKDVGDLKDKLEKQNQGKVENDNGKLKISLNNDILFASGSSALKPAVMPILEEVAKILKENPNYDVFIEGHTDNVPIRSKIFRDNWALSSARALAVVRTLIDKFEVDPSHLASIGRGEFSPVADNTTDEGRAKNRRIEINLIPRK